MDDTLKKRTENSYQKKSLEPYLLPWINSDCLTVTNIVYWGNVNMFTSVIEHIKFLLLY